jgi:AraC-like DNA-binding protein
MVNLGEDAFRTYGGPDGSSVHRTRGAVLEGPHAQPRVIDTRSQRRLVTVDFKLGGAASFFGAPLSEARDRLVDLEHLWGRDSAELRDRLLEAPTPEAGFGILEGVLLAHLQEPGAPDPAMRLAAAALERGESVAEVQARLGLLPKTFVRRFRAHTGLAPKRFSRVRRLQRVLRAIGPT